MALNYVFDKDVSIHISGADLSTITSLIIEADWNQNERPKLLWKKLRLTDLDESLSMNTVDTTPLGMKEIYSEMTPTRADGTISGTLFETREDAAYDIVEKAFYAQKPVLIRIIKYPLTKTQLENDEFTFEYEVTFRYVTDFSKSVAAGGLGTVKPTFSIASQGEALQSVYKIKKP